MLRTTVTSGCTYTSSGDYSTYTKDKAFDGNSSSYWVTQNTTAPKWITITLPSAKKVEFYGIKINDVANYAIEENAPVSWVLEVQENGSWYKVHEVVDYDGFINGVESIFSINHLVTNANFRLTFTKQKGVGNQIMITDIFLYDDMDKIDTSVNATYTSSGDYGLFYKKDYAFDNLVTQNQWVSSTTTPKWIQVDLTKSVFPTTLGYRVSRYGLLPGDIDTHPERAPKSWKLEGYDNVKGGWVKLDEVMGFDVNDFKDGDEKQFSIDSPIFVTKLKLTVSETNGSDVVSLKSFTLYEQPNFGNLVDVGTAIVNGLPKYNVCWMPETQLTYTSLQVIRKVYLTETVIATIPFANRMKVKSFIDTAYAVNGDNYGPVYWIKLVGCSDGQTHESIRIAPSRISSKVQNGSVWDYTLTKPILQSIGGLTNHNRFSVLAPAKIISGSTTMNTSGSTVIIGSSTTKNGNDKKSSGTMIVAASLDLAVSNLAASSGPFLHSLSNLEDNRLSASTYNTTRSNRQNTTVKGSSGPFVHSLSNLEDNRLM